MKTFEFHLFSLKDIKLKQHLHGILSNIAIKGTMGQKTIIMNLKFSLIGKDFPY